MVGLCSALPGSALLPIERRNHEYPLTPKSFIEMSETFSLEDNAAVDA